MEKSKFILHLDKSVNLLIDYAKTLCFNEFSDNYRFIIIPNDRNPHAGLNDSEVSLLRNLNRFKDRLLSAHQVIEILHQDNRVPLWINIDVYESRPEMTVINLFCSRRFREDKDLFYKVDPYPPFHIFVPNPPDSLRVEKNGKYDINWRKHLDEKRRPRNIFKRLLNLMTDGRK